MRYVWYYIYTYRVYTDSAIPEWTVATINVASNDGWYSTSAQFTIQTTLVDSMNIYFWYSASQISQWKTLQWWVYVRPWGISNKNISFTSDTQWVTLTAGSIETYVWGYYYKYTLSVDRNVPVGTVVTLTAVSDDWNASADFHFTVTAFVPVTWIWVDEEGKTLQITNSYNSVYPWVCPYSATIQTITATSSNPNIDVTYDGYRYTISWWTPGDTAYIEFTSDDWSYTTGFDVEIISWTPVESISFQEDGGQLTLHPWETYQLNASANPSNAANTQLDYYAVSEQCWALPPDFLTVSSTWLITISQNANDGDMCNVLVKTNDGWYEGYCSIYVSEYCMAYWTDKDWNIIETDYTPYGTTPVFNWSTPSCYDPGEITTMECVFDHWSPTPWPIYADTTYRPMFRNINAQFPPELELDDDN